MSLLKRIKYIQLFNLLFVSVLLSCNEDTIDPVFYGTLTGTVTFESSGLPAADVEISTTPSTSVIYTDMNGNFVIESLATGTYSVSATLEGYRSESKSVTIVKSAASTVELVLETEASTPTAARFPEPADKSIDVDRAVTLKWSVENLTRDELTYEVKVYESDNSTAIATASALTDTTLEISGLRFNTTYYWQVNVINSASVATFGEVWTFTTLPFPDNRILFSTQRDGNYEIYSGDVNGSNLARLTYNNTVDVYPRYSNDRSLIAYSSIKDLDFQLYIMEKDGAGKKQITTIPIAGYHNNGRGFCWSPDNGRFMYANYDKLYTIDRNGANLTLIATASAGRHYRSCDWTAVGDLAVVETVGVLPYDNEIRLVDFINNKDSVIVGNIPGTIQSPSFSIDGKYILYTYDVSEFESSDGRQLDSRMFLYELATGTSIDISGTKPAGTNDLNPRFSPDGARVIFENRPNDNSASPTLWLLNVADGSREVLIQDAGMPSWQ